jgi:hypothetical protein
VLYLLLQHAKAWLIDHDVYWLVRLLDQIQFRALASAALAFAVVLFLGPRVIAWLARKKIGDTGQSDTQLLAAAAGSKANTPTMGGILIVGAIGVCTFLLADLSERFVQLGLIVLVWLALVGFADDWLKLTAKQRGSGRQGLQEWEKLIFQLGVGLMVGYFLFVRPPLPTSSVIIDDPRGQSMSHVLTLPLQKTYVRPEREVAPAEPNQPAAQPALSTIPTAEQSVAQREPQWRHNPTLFYLPMVLYEQRGEHHGRDGWACGGHFGGGGIWDFCAVFGRGGRGRGDVPARAALAWERGACDSGGRDGGGVPWVFVVELRACACVHG